MKIKKIYQLIHNFFLLKRFIRFFNFLFDKLLKTKFSSQKCAIIDYLFQKNRKTHPLRNVMR